MPKRVKKNLHKIVKSELSLQTGWDAAISDAEKRIAQAQARITVLKLSIQTFRQQRDAGVPFPGEDVNQTAQANQ